MIFAFIGELLGELLFLLLNAVVGVPIAAAAYWLSLVIRRRLWHLDRTLVVETPDGVSYSLDVPRLRLRTPVTRRLTRSHTPSSETVPKWDEADRLHPGNMVDRLDMMLVFVVPFVLVAVLVVLLVLLLEVIIGLLVLAIGSVLATLIRHRWTCVVTGPDGETVHVRERGLRRIRRTRDSLAQSIRSGDLAALAVPGPGGHGTH